MKCLVGVAILSVLFQISCETNEVPRHMMGESVPADIIVIFRPGTSLEEKNRFDEETVGIRVIEGVELKKGIAAVLALPEICPNQDGVALEFRKNFTSDQLRDIRTAIDASPIVQRVLTDIRPKDVRCSDE